MTKSSLKLKLETLASDSQLRFKQEMHHNLGYIHATEAKKHLQAKKKINSKPNTAKNHAMFMFHSKMYNHHNTKSAHHFAQSHKLKVKMQSVT